MRNDFESMRRYYLGFSITCIVLVISIILVLMIAKNVETDISDIPMNSLIVFYAYLILIHAMSVWCWRLFSSTSAIHEHRTLSEALIDTGLISVGKYIPGKAMGILARGAFKDGCFVLSKASIATSASEQVYSLSSGIILVIAFLSYQYFSFHVAWVLVLLLVSISYLPMTINFLFKSTSFENYLPCIAPLKALSLSLGYIALWLVSSMPILTLISTAHQLELYQSLEIVTAFTSSIIAGWIAIFSPGGIGIREAAFAMSAPEWLDWKEGFFWIMMHRTLCIFFDLVFGSLSIACLFFELRRKTEKKHRI